MRRPALPRTATPPSRTPGQYAPSRPRQRREPTHEPAPLPARFLSSWSRLHHGCPELHVGDFPTLHANDHGGGPDRPSVSRNGGKPALEVPGAGCELDLHGPAFNGWSDGI